MKYFILFIFSLLLLTSCTRLESAGFEIGQDIGMRLAGEELEEPAIDIFCIEDAQKQRVDYVTLQYIGNDWYLKEFAFANGIKDKSVSIRYILGDREGENIDYYYPKNLLENNFLTYREEIVQNDVIVGYFTFKVKLILKKTTDEEILLNNTRYGETISSQRFEVVSAEYFDCSRP